MANPNVPQDRIPSSAAGTKLPSSERSAVSTPPLPPAEDSEENGYTGFELWLHRVTVLMFVFVCAVVGVLLVMLPWTTKWTDNRLLLAYPGLRLLVANSFVRGVCSGLGILDIWIGFWEAVHYHEEKP